MKHSSTFSKRGAVEAHHSIPSPGLSLRERNLIAIVLAVFALTASAAALDPAAAGRFVGDSRCGNPLCHGAALPADDADKEDWRPWKSARTQWLNPELDRHSRAFATLRTPAAEAIAAYMGIEATNSDKCLVCHAPRVEAVNGSSFQSSDGVSCEHCHGPAEHWLEAHVQKDWKEKRPSFAARGFDDLSDVRRHAEKCATCHLAIDHEIVAGGHPPLQFEPVSYGRLIQHWNNDEPSRDPTLWAVGQLIGLRRSAAMIARRAGESDYQGLKKFPHFENKNCYQCHHKLVEDGLRQGEGHYRMVTALFTEISPERLKELGASWSGLETAVATSSEQSERQATQLAAWIEPYESRVGQKPLSAAAAKSILARITADGQRLKTIRRFSHQRPPAANTAAIKSIDVPWWYTTGAPEQSILAIQALSAPPIPDDQLRRLLATTDRFNYDPEAYSKALGELHEFLSKRESQVDGTK